MKYDNIRIEWKNIIRLFAADEIIYIEAYKHHTMIHLADEKLECGHSLSYFHKLLDTRSFVRCHNSILVKLKYVISIMKYPKKFQIMLILSCIIGLTSMTAGLTYNGASTTGFFTIIQEAWFTPAWTVEANSGYGLITGEKVDRAYVRIIEGQYDTGRVWSSQAYDDESWDMISVSISKFNNPFETMYTYYGWSYFD